MSHTFSRCGSQQLLASFITTATVGPTAGPPETSPILSKLSLKLRCGMNTGLPGFDLIIV